MSYDKDTLDDPRQTTVFSAMSPTSRDAEILVIRLYDLSPSGVFLALCLLFTFLQSYTRHLLAQLYTILASPTTLTFWTSLGARIPSAAKHPARNNPSVDITPKVCPHFGTHHAFIHGYHHHRSHPAPSPPVVLSRIAADHRWQVAISDIDQWRIQAW